MLNLISAYNELISKFPKKEVGHLGDKPEVCSEIITPDSECIVKENFFGNKVVFTADESGMLEILKDFQISEEDQDLLKILTEIYDKVNNYFGGKNTDNFERINEYVASGFRSTLSQIKGKRIGQCAEKALVAHNILKAMIQAGHIKSYDSRFVSSKLNNSPHAFVVLENISQENGNSFIFDIENPANITLASGGKINTIGLYPISRSQLNEFYEGKSLKLKCIYDGVSGCKEDDIDRYYGNQIVQLPNFNTDARLD